MAVSNTVAIADGKPGNPAILVVDTDGTTSFLTGTDLGATVATSLGGVAVDASTAEAFASAGALGPDDLIKATVADLDSKVTGCAVSWTKNKDSIYTIRFNPIAGIADDVQLSSAVFTPGT